MQIQAPIHSRFNNKHIALPLYIFSIVVILAACANVGKEEKDPYDFHGLLIFTFHSSWVLGTALLLIIISRKSLIVTDSKLTQKNVFGTVSEEYLFEDITDMSWDNRPRRAGKYSSSLKMHESFVLTFKSGKELYLDIEDYSNLSEIRSFLFDYCEAKGIVYIRPLARRKRLLKRR